MKDLVILHGALGYTGHLEPMAELFKNNYHVHIHLFTGHGGKPIHGTFSISNLCNDLREFLQERQLIKPLVIGYGMGGYVALFTEKEYPGTFEAIVTLGTKFNWTPETASKEAALLHPQKLQEKLPAYARELELRHAPAHWEHVLLATAGMMRNMGLQPPLAPEFLDIVKCPVFLAVGDKDKMVGINETEDFFLSLPIAQMAVLPNTQHPIEKIDLDLFYFLANRFFHQFQNAR